MSAHASRPGAAWAKIGAASALAAILAVLAFWALTAPPLATIDEPRHVNSVLRLMQGGGWPPPQTAPMTEGTLLAMQEAGYPLGSEQIAPVPAEQRSVVTDLDAAGMDGRVPLDWMNQHPPTYYAILAGVAEVLGADEWRWDQLLMLMRFTSILMVGGGLWFVLGALRRLVGAVPAVIVGLVAVIGLPQFFNVLSLVTNDALALLAASGFIYFLVRAWTGPAGRNRALLWNAFGAGAMLGIGLLTKGTLLTAIPMVFLVLLVAGARLGGAWWRRLLPAAASMVVAFVVGGWWYLRNILVYGVIQSSNSGMGRSSEPADGYALGDFAAKSLSQLVETFWGSIRTTLDVPGWLLVVLAVSLLAALVVVLVTSRHRALIVLLLVYPACIAGLILFHAWEVYWNEVRLAGVQGRYFFAAIAIFSLVIALTWVGLAGRRGAATRIVLTSIMTLVPLAVGAWGARFAFLQRWGRDIDLAEAWTVASAAGPLPPGFLTLVVVVALVASLAATAIAVVAASTSGGPRNARDVAGPSAVLSRKLNYEH